MHTQDCTATYVSAEAFAKRGLWVNQPIPEVAP